MLDPIIPTQPHHLEAERISLEIARRQTVAQKLDAIYSLQKTAIELKRSLIKSENPELSEEEVKQKVRDWVLYGSL